MVVPAKIISPFKVLIWDTPPEPPPPLVKQVEHVRLPAASKLSGPEAETATVPLALGRVIVLFERVGVANTKLLLMPPEVADKDVLPSPCKTSVWLAVPTVKVAVGVMVLTVSVPPIVTVLPLSEMIESPMAEPLVNLATLPAVPPAVVTPPPTPAQLPAVVQTLSVPILAPVAETLK